MLFFLFVNAAVNPVHAVLIPLQSSLISFFNKKQKNQFGLAARFIFSTPRVRERETRTHTHRGRTKYRQHYRVSWETKTQKGPSWLEKINQNTNILWDTNPILWELNSRLNCIKLKSLQHKEQIKYQIQNKLKKLGQRPRYLTISYFWQIKIKKEITIG